METIAVELVVIFFLILANGFFSGSELAIISARKSTIARLVAEGNSRAMVVEKLQNDPHRFLATVQIGVTVVGSLASAVGGATAVAYLKPLLDSAPYALVRETSEPISIGLVVALVSYFSLILGELAPKTIGLQFADNMSLVVAKPINALATIGGVAVKFLTLSNRAVLTLLGVKPTSGQEFITREEVLHTLSEGGETGALTEHEHKVIENMLDFSRTQVSQVMVPRNRMIALDKDSPKETLMQIVRENMYTRYPVYQNDRENIVGFIHCKDLFLHHRIEMPDFTLDEILRPPLYVPENKRASDLLREMQQKRMQMALVVDEYGDIIGLVTTEDLLEELVGEIEDEHDVGELPRFERLPDGTYLVDGILSLNDLEEIIDVKFEDGLPFDTLAGMILSELGRFPKKGEKIECHDLVLICEEITPTSIVKVRVIVKG
ncbi:MAG: HlyC/CorC family transporter [Geobacteraceae bacterium]|nr:HlyC/CorC family transporter [Geobacteraceae bacterium]NTW80612.1 HlyC/CorC family transporter [Geobacteraceae bacterium]